MYAIFNQLVKDALDQNPAALSVWRVLLTCHLNAGHALGADALLLLNEVLRKANP